MLTQHFEQKYPFIKTETLRLGTDQLLTKIQTEARAGAFRADVIEIPGILGQVLKQDGLLEKYISPESKAYPASMKDPDGTWTSFFINTHVTVYNTNLVKKQEVPKTFEDFINPRSKGKIAFRDNDFDNFGMMLKVMGREKGLNFMRRLAAQGVDLRSSFAGAVQGISAGEIPIGMNLYGTHTEEFKKKNAPVDWAPMEFVLASIEPLGVGARAPNPNAARLFVEYVLSYEGQKIVRDNFRVTARSDIPPLVKKLDMKRLRTFFVNPKIAARYGEFQKDYQEIFGR
jgi:iron(III) transport system substrate-binding protein